MVLWRWQRKHVGRFKTIADFPYRDKAPILPHLLLIPKLVALYRYRRASQVVGSCCASQTPVHVPHSHSYSLT